MFSSPPAGAADGSVVHSAQKAHHGLMFLSRPAGRTMVARGAGRAATKPLVQVAFYSSPPGRADGSRPWLRTSAAPRLHISYPLLPGTGERAKSFLPP